jgi:hypothetical protein
MADADHPPQDLPSPQLFTKALKLDELKKELSNTPRNIAQAPFERATSAYFCLLAKIVDVDHPPLDPSLLPGNLNRWVDFKRVEKTCLQEHKGPSSNRTSIFCLDCHGWPVKYCRCGPSATGPIFLYPSAQSGWFHLNLEVSKSASAQLSERQKGVKADVFSSSESFFRLLKLTQLMNFLGWKGKVPWWMVPRLLLL